MTTVSDFTALLSGYYWNGIEATGQPVIVTYSFPTSAPAYDLLVQGFTASTVASFQAFSATAQTQARQALGEWAAASGLVFVEVSPGAGDINFQVVDLSTSSYGSPGGIAFSPFGNWDYFTYPSYSSGLDSSGDVFMNSQFLSGGAVNYGTLLHEIGHAIGLKHPTEVVYSPGAAHEQVLDTGNDPTRTIMATVGDPANTDPHLLTLDRNAAAFIYGASGGQVVTASTSGANAVSAWNWNAATQTLTQTAAASGATIRGSSVTDVITATLGNNRLFGLNGSDTLTGGTGDDYLDGGPGVDTMSGGDGNDSYSVDDATDQVIETPTGGGNDIVRARSNFVLSANVETLQLFGVALTGTGNALGNTIYGDGSFSGTLLGLGGEDYIVAGRNNDVLNGGSENDLLYGQAGNDTLIGDTGNDLLHGGPGFDTADYSADVLGRTINLVNGTAILGADSDTLVSIERVRGGGGNDTITAGPGTAFNQGDLIKPVGTQNLNVDTAVDLDGAFRIKSDAAVPNSSTIPHATVVASTNGGNEFYAFSVVDPGGVVTIQAASTGSAFTPFVSIFSADGTLLASQTMTSGSTSLSFTFAAGGEYLIEVQDSTLGPYGDHNPVPAGGAYTLQVSLTNVINHWLEGGGGNDTLLANVGWERLDGGAGIDTVSFAGLGFAVNASLASGSASGANGNYQLIGIENLTGSSFADTLTGNGIANILSDGGGPGIDTLAGGAGNDTYNISNAGAAITELAGGGTDQIVLGTGVSGALAGIAGVESITLASGSNALTLSAGNFAGVTGPRIAVLGNSGNDIVDGSGLGGANAIDVTAGAGSDTVRGGAGNDIFHFAPSLLTSADTIQGGGGTTDQLIFDTAGTIAAASLANVDGIERVILANGTNDITLSLGMATSPLNSLIQVFGGTGNDRISAVLLSNGVRVDVTSGAGLDTLLGSGAKDTFRFAGVDLAGDTVNGGADFDTLIISSADVVTAADLALVSSIDQINLNTGGISLMLDNAVAAANAGVLVVFASSGNDTIDASAVTSTRAISVTAGAGSDTLRGGTGNDAFRFSAADLTAADTVVGGGGAGIDAINFQTAGTVTAASLAGVLGIERLALAVGTNSVTLTDALVSTANGAAMTIYTNSGDDTVDGSALTGTNRLEIYTGFGNDTLRGGAGNDIFRFSVDGLDGSDLVAGGAGFDQLNLSNAGALTAAKLAGVSGIDQIVFSISGVTMTLNNAVAAANAAVLAVFGSIGNDTVDASAVTDTTRGLSVTALGGNDSFRGGLGTDTFRFNAADLTSLDTVQGGGGTASDGIVFLTAGSVTTAAFANVSGIEVLSLAVGGISLALTNAMVASASNALVTVNGSTGNDTVNAAAVTTATNRITVNAGAGSDTLTGGAGNDTIEGGDGADTLTGGGGTDLFVWRTRYTAPDAILDFLGAADRLQFTASAFDFNGAAFDQRLATNSAATDITGQDLVIYTGSNLNSIGDVASYLGSATGGSNGEGIFILGQDSGGHTVLYHALDASFTTSTDIVEVADLGASTSPNATQLADFVFI